jgi:hypothetical protein
MVRAFDLSRGFSRLGEMVTQVASTDLVVARGGVGMLPPGALREKSSTDEGGLSQKPSLRRFWRRLALQRLELLPLCVCPASA